MVKAEKSGRSLTKYDAGIVKGMLKRGDRQHDVASWFGVNGGRIAEINKGMKFPDAEPVSISHLPPSGPYISGERSARKTEDLRELRLKLIKFDQLIASVVSDERLKGYMESLILDVGELIDEN